MANNLRTKSLTLICRDGDCLGFNNCAFCGIVRKKAPLEYTEDTMGGKKIGTSSIETLFAKFCLKEDRKIGHGEFLFFNGSDYSYRGPHQYWETHLNSTFRCQCLGPEFVFPTKADKS